MRKSRLTLAVWRADGVGDVDRQDCTRASAKSHLRPTSALRPDARATAASKVEQPFEQPSRPASSRPLRTFDEASLDVGDVSGCRH
jgi:hypothetical protein